MTKTTTDLEVKKSIHFTLTKATHAELRIRLFKHGLSMQEVFEEFAQRIAADMSESIELLEEVSLNKRNKALKKFSKSDAESIFSVIESENPLSEG